MRSLRIVLIGLALVLTAACGGTTDQVPEGPEDTEDTASVSPSPDEVTSPTDEATGGTAASSPCDQYEPESQVSDNVLAIDSPSADSTFPPGSTVAGCTNAFEASFQWELLGADGEVLASGNETATCGSGCLGAFEFTVDYEVDEAQEGTLRLFVESAEDGSTQMENEVSVQLLPE